MMQNETTSPKIGIGIFYTALFLLGILLLALIPYQTKPGPEGQGWWTQPNLMPLFSLLIFALSATFLSVQHLRRVQTGRAPKANQKSIITELIHWVKPFEFFVYYILYIFLLGWVGYFLSSLIFIVGLSLRVGLKSRRWMLVSLLFAITLIAMFRWALGVWIPPADLYDIFPKNIRSFLIQNF